MHFNKKDYPFLLFIVVILIILLITFLIKRYEIGFAPGSVVYGEGNYSEGPYNEMLIYNPNGDIRPSRGVSTIIARNFSNTSRNDGLPLSETDEGKESNIKMNKENTKEQSGTILFIYLFLTSLLIVAIIIVSIFLVYHIRKNRRSKISKSFNRTIRFINNKNSIKG